MSGLLWFSPKPPARTDIANYSARVVPALANHLALDWLDPAEPQGQAAHDPRFRNRAGLSCHNIGNNPQFHGAILQIAQVHPGVVILHDRCLQDLCFAVPSDHGQGGNPYRAAMVRWYGRAGAAAADAALSGAVTPAELGTDFPLFEEAVAGALAVVTHNPAVADEIAERFPGLPVLALPLPFPVRSRAGPAYMPPAADEPIRLVAFGFLNRNRRLVQIIEAWARSPARGRFRLDLAGELHNAGEVAAALEQSGLDPQVTIHGFLPEPELDRLIAGAHLVFNLRNPSMGEASGSQLRIWANGVPSAVTATGWYATLPPDAALPISADDEAGDLAALFAGLAAGTIDLNRLAERSRQALQAHDPDAYAARLAAWITTGQGDFMAAWAERALIEAAARGHAAALPARIIPRLPARLIR